MAIDIRRTVKGPDGEEEVFRPYQDEAGFYTLARPHAGTKRNSGENQVKVRSLEEAADQLAQECSIRMESNHGRKGLYSPKSDEFSIEAGEVLPPAGNDTL